MALKGQPRLDIDWDVVRDALAMCWSSQGTVEHPVITEQQVRESIYQIYQKHCPADDDVDERYANTVVSASLRYALDGSFVNKSENGAIAGGLTVKGLELLNMLTSKWVWREIRNWASRNDMMLTANIIINVGNRVISSRLNNSYTDTYTLRNNVRSYCV